MSAVQLHLLDNRLRIISAVDREARPHLDGPYPAQDKDGIWPRFSDQVYDLHPRHERHYLQHPRCQLSGNGPVLDCVIAEANGYDNEVRTQRPLIVNSGSPVLPAGHYLDRWLCGLSGFGQKTFPGISSLVRNLSG